MAWLTDFTQQCVTQLGDVNSALTALQNDCEAANNDYYQTGTNLVQEKQYSGAGARAFLAELNTDINTHDLVMDGIGHVASAAQVCSDAISSSSTVYDKLLNAIQPSSQNDPTDAQYLSDVEIDAWRSALINDTLSNAAPPAAYPGLHDPLDSILVSGSGVLIDSFSAAKRTVRSAVDQYVDNQIEMAESVSDSPDSYGRSEGDYFANNGGAQIFARIVTMLFQIWPIKSGHTSHPGPMICTTLP